MTQSEAMALTPGHTVTFKANPSATPVVGIVLNNGPRLDANGTPIPFMNDLLVIQLGQGQGQTTVSWEPVNYSQGIPEISL